MLYSVCFIYTNVGRNNSIRNRYIVYSDSKAKAIEKVKRVISPKKYFGYYLDKIKVNKYTNIEY